MRSVFTIWIFLCCFNVKAQSNDTLYLIFLGGQSNMAGLGKNKELPDSIQHYHFKSMIFQGNPVRNGDSTGGFGKWEQLKPGHGSGFAFKHEKNRLSHLFGIELGMAYDLEHQYPEKQFAFIKYAKGGSSLEPDLDQYGSWIDTTKINQLDFAIRTIDSALVQLQHHATSKIILKPILIGWLQGETDACHQKGVENYSKNIGVIMNALRLHLGNSRIPICIQTIHNPEAQCGVKTMPFYEDLATVFNELPIQIPTTKILAPLNQVVFLKDLWHYTTESYLYLGQEFGKQCAF